MFCFIRASNAGQHRLYVYECNNYFQSASFICIYLNPKPGLIRNILRFLIQTNQKEGGSNALVEMLDPRERRQFILEGRVRQTSTQKKKSRRGKAAQRRRAVRRGERPRRRHPPLPPAVPFAAGGAWPVRRVGDTPNWKSFSRRST